MEMNDESELNFEGDFVIVPFTILAIWVPPR